MSIFDTITTPTADTETETTLNTRWFSSDETVTGSPRLIRAEAFSHTTSSGITGWMVEMELVIRDFSVTSELYNSDRFSTILEHQTRPAMVTSFFVPRHDSQVIMGFFAALEANGFKARTPYNKKDAKRTSVRVVKPTTTYDPQNPEAYGVAVDFELLPERNEARKDFSFDGDYAAVAEALVPRIENAVELDDADLAQQVIWSLNRIAGDKPATPQGGIFAKNVGCARICVNDATLSLWNESGGSLEDAFALTTDHDEVTKVVDNAETIFGKLR